MNTRAAALIAGCVLAGVGTWSGRALATVTYSTGTAAEAFPLVRPAPGAFATLVTINTNDTVGTLEIGRDDLSPWAAVNAQIAAPPEGLDPNIPYRWIYRPLWDVQIPNRPSFPESDHFAAQWTACDVFARHATTMRTNMGNQGVGMIFYVDLNSIVNNPAPPGNPNQHSLEFYKYRMAW